MQHKFNVFLKVIKSKKKKIITFSQKVNFEKCNHIFKDKFVNI